MIKFLLNTLQVISTPGIITIGIINFFLIEKQSFIYVNCGKSHCNSQQNFEDQLGLWTAHVLKLF